MLCLLFVAIALLYLNQIGLPERVRERLTAGLREKGWEVQYSQFRLSVRRPGIIAENLYLHRTNLWSGPQIYVQEARCRLRDNALKKFQVQFESAQISGGRLLWPLVKTNQLESTLLINNVGGNLLFRPNDVWELRALRGTMLGVQLNVSGVISNASYLRDWKLPKATRPATPATYNQWRSVLAAAEKFRFFGAPEVAAQFTGDASRLDTLEASILFHVPGFASPWANGTNFLLSAFSQRGGELDGRQRLSLDCLLERGASPWLNGRGVRVHSEFPHRLMPWTLPTNLSVQIEAQELEHPKLKARNLSGASTISLPGTNGEPRRTDWNLRAAELEAKWGTARDADIRLAIDHSSTNWLPRFLSNTVEVVKLRTKWGVSDSVRFGAGVELVAGRPLTNWLEQIHLDGFLTGAGIVARDAHAKELQFKMQWMPPELKLQVDGEIEDGRLHAGATLNATNRELAFRANTTLDPHRISSLLTTNTRRWLANYHWEQPPLLQAQGKLRLPMEPREAIDWAREVMPTLEVAGEFQIGQCAYRSVPFETARSPFWFSNSVFCLPEAVVTRPEGSASGAYTSKPASKEFHWNLRSNIDPKILRPLFNKTIQERVFDAVEFSAPPELHGQIWGRWYDPESTAVVAEVAVTNMTFRGQKASFARSSIVLTNQVLEFLNPLILRMQETGTATRVAIDIKGQRIYFTNVHGNLSPYAVTAAIGRGASNAIAPYRFSLSPEINLNGVLDIRRNGWEDDMHFTVNGGTFFWNPFHAQKVGGQIHWVGRTVLLSDMIALLHNGQAKGDAKFEISPGNAQFNFTTQWSDIDIRSLMTDFSTKTNRLEGVLRGELQITSAQSSNPKSWQGRGIVELKDGLIWDFPVFGVFSPILNTFVPGLGNSRAREGSASYIITNSVIHTVDLQIHATAMRMQLEGTVDFDRNINGRAEAELLRDVPGIGLVISKILWPVTKIFEYRVTGTLQEPQTEPLYILPKVILFPLQPFKALKDLFTPQEPGK